MRRRSHLPGVMRPVSADQLLVDSSFNLGKNVVLQPADNSFGNTVFYVVPGPGNISDNSTLPEQRLVRAYSGDLYANKNPWDGYSWILSGGITQSGTQDAPNNSSNVFRLRILFGSGGTMLEAVVSVSPQFALAIPSNSVDVSVFLPASFPNDQLQPGDYRIAAILHRGNPITDTGGRLITLSNDGVNPTEILIPKFAKRLQTLGPTTAAVYGAGITMIFNNAGNIGSDLAYTGPELLALKNAGTKIEIPAGTISVGFTGVGAALPELSWDIEL